MKTSIKAKKTALIFILILSLSVLSACKGDNVSTDKQGSQISDDIHGYGGSLNYTDDQITEDEGYFGMAELDDGDFPVFYYAGLTYVLIDDHAETIYTLYMDDTLDSYKVRSFIEYEGKQYTVTTIRENTFSYCADATEIIIPPTITTIESFAFDGCYALEKIDIPSSVSTLGHYCFGNCESMKNIVIPDTVTAIGDYLFNECIGLESAALPNGLKVIPESTFSGCTALTSVVIPDTVEVIGPEAFWYCESLPEIKFPAGLTTIADRALYDCMELTEITIPASLTYLGEDAFTYCDSLEVIKVPEGRYDEFEFLEWEYDVTVETY